MSLILRNVSKSFKEFAVKGIDLKIEQGEYFVILGPSGAGKTLILEMIAGLLPPDSGKILGVEGRKTGFIYQDYMLFPHLDVYENITYGLRMQKKKKEEIKPIVEKLTEELNISHLLGRDVLHLSGGEKQRVAIARAMAISPDIFLFDEPTAALDRNARIKTHSLFLDWHKKDKKSTFIHVTHDFEEALSLGDRIGILLDGCLVQYGPPDEVFNHPLNKEVADFLGYRNVYGGPVRDNTLHIDGTAIAVPVENAEHIYIAIRSDDVILSRGKFESSARNAFPGEVKNVLKKASVIEVILDIGIILSIDITRKSYEEMDIKIGDRLWATFKVSALKFFEH
ncbi:MAG: ATP-binding cassette domain-containing protein [Candidatus Aminicenantes bacterium]|nr:ATP-binding cassette domain-containing protein [Candidatus Aminicenantes bacterium]NIM80037.1 ATP-binding cassette domain-containing protein [Candidatus Aminicenantes bacterium]NIN19380.1 ATP-binding cassette domain-containing protein [Candidatus Aminicenantes bacterium]NIN43279.1 ATP-binding cassette domain-containing protein [Candidatus Aminicenantes bacterium]NIN86023.1 ATP-binding cassette domain-containing protein [Candidatus Aminicenantes bacterium]